MFDSIDWNTAWQEARRQRRHDHGGKQHWNKRAPSFAQHARTSTYQHDFVRMMAPQPGWSVLDVGCGAGTLAIPLASRVQRVTAIDLSDAMIGLLREHCREQRLDNIHSQVVSWEDDWDKAGIDVHDVAIASRSLVVNDLRTALTKLQSKARHRVYLASLVGDGPFDRRIFEAIGRELNRGPDYIYVYNLLYQMGIHAEVQFINNGDGGRVYRDLEEALDKFHWMLGQQTAEESARLRRFFEDHLHKTDGGWTLTYRHVVRWAIISWCPDQAKVG